MNPAVTESFAVPSLKVRLACMLYEGMLLFGVLFAADWAFSVLFQQRHALQMREAGQIWLFLVLGLYFAWFWSHGGQTLPMKTWRIRVQRKDGSALGFGHAVLRYLLCWFWLLPGLALAWLTGARGPMLLIVPLANLFLWSLTVFLDSDRQFLHDRIAGTRLVRTAAPAPAAD